MSYKLSPTQLKWMMELHGEELIRRRSGYAGARATSPTRYKLEGLGLVESGKYLSTRRDYSANSYELYEVKWQLTDAGRACLGYHARDPQVAAADAHAVSCFKQYEHLTQVVNSDLRALAVEPQLVGAYDNWRNRLVAVSEYHAALVSAERALREAVAALPMLERALVADGAGDA